MSRINRPAGNLFLLKTVLPAEIEPVIGRRFPKRSKALMPDNFSPTARTMQIEAGDIMMQALD